MNCDYTKHDARITCDIGRHGETGFMTPVTDRYSWECIRCGAGGKRYATGLEARGAAEVHNGGPYNEA